MGATNGDGSFEAHQFTQHFGAAHHGHKFALRRHQLLADEDLSAEVRAITGGKLDDIPPGPGAALGALALMMRLLRSVSFSPYVIYRVILGAGLLWYAYA